MPQVEEPKTTLDEVTTSFRKYMHEDLEGALQLITGMFVSVSEVYMEVRGYSSDGEIRFTTGAKQRDITIHPVKPDSEKLHRLAGDL